MKETRKSNLTACNLTPRKEQCQCYIKQQAIFSPMSAADTLGTDYITNKGSQILADSRYYIRKFEAESCILLNIQR